jgi:cyanophycinase
MTIRIRFAFVFLFAFALTARANLVRYWSGNPVDVSPPLHGPVLDLAGSSAEETALQEMIDRVRGCRDDCAAKLDVVVIRASGSDGLNPVFMSLNGVNSVVTLLITDRASAERRDVAQIVNNAEIVWFAGGDQCNYIRWIKGTPVHRAVERVFRRGGGVGGNSAGLAIQGEIVYDACPDQSAASKDVLLNPFSVDVTLSSDFFRWPVMRGIITDTHFHQRDRFGRLAVFLARANANGKRVIGVAADEQTSIIVSSDGIGRVFGPGAAYVVVPTRQAELLAKGTPLTYRGLRVFAFRKGATVDLRKTPESGGRIIDIVDGKLSADPY